MTEEPVKAPQNNNSDNADKGTEPDKTDNTAFDPSAISDDDFAKIFEDNRLWKHDRFKKLNSKAKRADELESQIEKQKQQDLEKNQEWEKLAKEREQEVERLKQSYQSEKLANALRLEATKQGAVDVETVLKLVDQSSITINDDGIEGVTNAVKKLLDEKPFLVGGKQREVGKGTNPSNPENSAPKKFKLSQLQDPKFFRENEKDINIAMRLGLIEDDMAS